MSTELSADKNQKQCCKFEELFFHYKNLMLHIARDVTGSTALAEDAVQDALVKILLHIDDIRDVRSKQTKGWVILITKRAAIDKKKYESLRAHENEDTINTAAHAHNELENTVIQNLALQQVKDGLRRLGERDFEMVMLRYYCGYSDVKLAKHYAISPALVRKRCERARKRLLSDINNRRP